MGFVLINSEFIHTKILTRYSIKSTWYEVLLIFDKWKRMKWDNTRREKDEEEVEEEGGGGRGF